MKIISFAALLITYLKVKKIHLFFFIFCLFIKIMVFIECLNIVCICLRITRVAVFTLFIV